ncbi:PASTA domain-containing protein [Flavisolibacter ginsengisoli]|uniref:PASTA domain, binds beta-lactams n=1 Tax=Flavisolibacter ginsengisoli DSM 18119 TaxID=1121884 RepID=A0A1M4X3G7_9BACT|nr:PASTA domain-containing protein [Flavisolibacter ginsengisoli]SHE88011.1 PASTA domain, binds beta-lactams [Flavisolibacter ginsengisoli DSM 18119]
MIKTQQSKTVKPKHSRPLWFHMVIALVAIIVLILVFLLSLNWITRHGESRTVPAVVGKNISEVEKFLETKGFDVVVQDSAYYDSLPPGFVLRQVPEADEVVKINRTVYVTINRFVPPDVEMPNLLGSSYRNAEMVLKNMGLRLGDTTYRFDFAKNSVLEQLYNGNSIKAGTKLKMGSTISLVLGSGLGSEDINVPDLVGRSYDEARALLDAQGLSGLVIVDPNVKDTASAFVYKQNPMPRTIDGARLRIRPGQMIDIWLSLEKPVTDSVEVKQQPMNQEP